MSWTDPTKLKEEIEKIVLLLVLLPLMTSSAPEVGSPWGQIEGVTLVSPDNRTYHGFLGIPYALPPTGDRRFARPAPHPGTSGVFRAVTSPPACPQPDPEGADVSEDCLRLSVYVPASSTSNGTDVTGTASRDVNVTVTSEASGNATVQFLRPVVVVLHGGGFISGSADDVNAWKLVTHADVIVVAVQYRLGALGFLSTGDDVIAGNWALWDQKMALEWVRANIRGFGGDPEAVTLMGDSAGAAAAGLLTLHPGARGLFAKVLLQSGAPTASWAVQPLPVARARALTLARELGCSLDVTSSLDVSRAVLSCLRSLPASVIAAASRLDVPLETSLTQNLWAPVEDGAFVLRRPEAAMADPDFLSKVPFGETSLLVNLNNNEGGLLLDYVRNEPQGTAILTDPEFFRNRLLPALLEQSLGHEVPDWVADVVMAYYVTGGNVTLRAALDSYADFIFMAPAIRYARAHAQQSSGSTHVLFLDHYPPDLPLGISHSDEGRYLGGLEEERDDQEESPPLPEDQYRKELEVSRIFVSLVGQFFSFNRSGLPLLPRPLSGDWPEYSPLLEHFVRVTSLPDVRQHLTPTRLALHLELLPATLRVATPPGTSTTPTAVTSTKSPNNDWLFGVDRNTAKDILIGIIALAGFLMLVIVIMVTFFFCKKERSTDYSVESEYGVKKYYENSLECIY